MRLRVTLLSLVMIAALPAAGSSSAAPPAPTDIAGQQELCFGQVATIVGTPGQEVVLGTEGADVIVTNGALAVMALGGDDLVCVRYEPSDASTVSIALGPGADQFLGSSLPETVDATDEGTGEVDRDIVDTGGGRDHVLVGGPGHALAGDDASVAEVSQDIVRLGRGYDWLEVNGPVSAATLDGGPGLDGFLLGVGFPRGVHLTIDNRREQMTLDDDVVARWSSFSDFSHGGVLHAPFTFLGSNQLDRLGGRYDYWNVQRRYKADVRMGGGDDKATLAGGAPGSRIDGGRGADLLWNLLWNWQSGSGVLIYGGIGNDHLRGSKEDDTLVGGPGYDTGNGFKGIDRCLTEVRVACER